MGAVRFELIGKVDGVPRVVVEHITRTDAESDQDWENPPAGHDGCYRIKITGEPMMQVDFTHHGEHGDHNVSGMITTAQRIINALPGGRRRQAGARHAPSTCRWSPAADWSRRARPPGPMSILDSFAVPGQVAIVTGAGRGLGAATAVALAEAGADVLISARTADQLAEVARQDRGRRPPGRRRTGRPQRPRRGRGPGADGVRRARPDRHRGQQRRRHASRAASSRPARGSSPRRSAFNVATAHALTRAAVPLMLKSDVATAQQSVVTISSMMGRTADRGYVAYGTAKAALAHWTRLAAFDLAPRIRVNGDLRRLDHDQRPGVRRRPAGDDEPDGDQDPARQGRRPRGHRGGRALPELRGRQVRHGQAARGRRRHPAAQPRPGHAGRAGCTGRPDPGTPTAYAVSPDSGRALDRRGRLGGLARDPPDPAAAAHGRAQGDQRLRHHHRRRPGADRRRLVDRDRARPARPLPAATSARASATSGGSW